MTYHEQLISHSLYFNNAFASFLKHHSRPIYQNCIIEKTRPGTFTTGRQKRLFGKQFLFFAIPFNRTVDKSLNQFILCCSLRSYGETSFSSTDEDFSSHLNADIVKRDIVAGLYSFSELSSVLWPQLPV